MPDDRRSFIKKFGVTLGSLIASGALPGCGPKQEGGSSNTTSQVGKPNASTLKPRDPGWEQLRQCWLDLNNRQDIRNTLNQNLEVLREGKDPDTATKDALAKKHQAILNTLVARGQLKKPVVRYIQIAFEEAAYHVVRSMSTCYMELPFEYTPRENLLQQAEVLRKISGDLDPATVAKAQAAITQDIAFFEIFRAPPGSRGSWADDYRAGKLEASPEELEAARLLTALFLEKPD